MVRGLKLSFFGLLMVALASCSPPTPTPTPFPTNTPLPPPPTPVVVTIDASAQQVPPTWTPVPTEPPAATSTRRPTSTPFASPVLTDTPSKFTGQLGVLSADNTIVVALTKADLEAELVTERTNALYSSIVSSPPEVNFVSRAIRLEVLFNNYTTEGLRGEVDFTLRSAGRRIRADVTGHRTERGTLLTPTQISAVRDMLNNVLERLLAVQLTQAAIPFENPQVVSFLVEETRLVVTVRLKLLPTPTEGEVPPTDVPPEAPTEATSTEPAPTEAAPTEAASATPITPTDIPTLFPTASAP